MELTETSAVAKTPAAPARQLRIGRHRELITAFVTLGILIAIIGGVSATPLGYYDVSQIVTGGTTLAIASMGQTLVILSGGFDLSAAAVVSLVNVTLASLPPGAVTSPLLIMGIGIGALVGMFNGFFVAFLRLQPIVVTLAMNGILQGAALLYSGGTPDGFAAPLLRTFMSPV